MGESRCVYVTYIRTTPERLWQALVEVAGVPMLERSLRKKRPGYDDYRERVPAFFPRPPSAIARSRSAR